MRKDLARHFNDYLQKQHGKDGSQAGSAQDIAAAFIEYIETRYPTAFRKNLVRESVIQEFVDSKYANLIKPTRDRRTELLKQFQAFVRRRWLVRWFGLASAVIASTIGFIITVSSLGQALGLSPDWWLPPPIGTLVAQIRATATLTPSPTLTVTPSPAPPPIPVFRRVIDNYDTAGYSKQTPLLRDSEGNFTLFIRNNLTGQLAVIFSSNAGLNWSQPLDIDTILPQPHVSAAIDRSNQIHFVWGVVPDPGDLNYGLIRDGELIERETLGSGVFARDIAIDSANRPHVVWTATDVQYMRFDGTRWLTPESVGTGMWHPDIQLDAQDNVYIFGNTAQFFPESSVQTAVFNNSQRTWGLDILSNSQFWSAGAAAMIDSTGNIDVFWFGVNSIQGGDNFLYFTRNVKGIWQAPFQLDFVYTTTGTTGQESPAVGIDANDIVYVVWRGFNDRSRPVIYARCFIPNNGWLPRITLDDRAAVDVGWPAIADTREEYRVSGVDIVWPILTGTMTVINLTHFDCLK
ncbi:MAG: hypothetical protein J0M33_13500 [Anaerolineae bacterium]|nr:hypothetical protein [Anaerolineae bacterium]